MPLGRVKVIQPCSDKGWLDLQVVGHFFDVP